MTYYGIEATHVGMCKFDSNLAPGYRNLATSLREWAGAAPLLVESRWEEEHAGRLARARREVQDRIAKYNHGYAASGGSRSRSSSPAAAAMHPFRGAAAAMRWHLDSSVASSRTCLSLPMADTDDGTSHRPGSDLGDAAG